MDNIPKGLTIQHRTGVTLFNSSWTAGVDFDDEQFKNDDYSMSSDDSEESEGEYDEIDKNELAEIPQEAPAQTEGVDNTNNTGVREVEENEEENNEEEQSLSDNSNEEGDANTQQEDDEQSSTVHKFEDVLVDLCPGVYDEYIVYEQGQEVLYVKMLMVLYGMLIPSILFYKKFCKDIEAIGFEVNPYD
eukprot:13601709-Ditylum_brightwellii.AAC.1